MQRRSTSPATVMVLFKYSWFQRFVIELTRLGGEGRYSTAHVWIPNREVLKPQRNRHLSLTFTFYSWLKDHYKSAPSAGRLPLGTEEISFIYSCLWPGSLLRQRMQLKYKTPTSHGKQNWNSNSSTSGTSANSLDQLLLSFHGLNTQTY